MGSKSPTTTKADKSEFSCSSEKGGEEDDDWLIEKVVRSRCEGDDGEEEAIDRPRFVEPTTTSPSQEQERNATQHGAFSVVGGVATRQDAVDRVGLGGPADVEPSRETAPNPPSSSRDNSGLVSAWRVSNPENLPQATPEETKTEQDKTLGPWKLRARMVVCLVALLAIAAIATAVAIVVSRSDDQSEIEPTPQEGAFKDIVMVAFGEDYFDDPVKNQAWHWIVHEDPLSLLWADLDLSDYDDRSRILQRFALAAFYFETSKTESWTYCGRPTGNQSELCYYVKGYFDLEYLGIRWLSDTHECQWMGVLCGDNSTAVDQISIVSNNLHGPVPTELSVLTKMTTLELTGNSLSGPLPPWVVDFPILASLDLGENLFTGIINPDYFTSMPLDSLSLSKNGFSGTIPTEIGVFHGRTLGLGDNEFTGTIPEELYSLSTLEKLFVGARKLGGTLSTRIGQMAGLQSISVGKCSITGTLPSELGLLSSLINLELYFSSLSGTIPEELYKGGLNHVYLRDNRLTGTISSRIGNMINMETFVVSNNNLSGTVPVEIAALALNKLSEFHVDGNPRLTGSMPEEFCSNMGGMTGVSADCTKSAETGVASIFCPPACCTTCCGADTGICTNNN